MIILLDFAENYSFFVQDAVQGYHWNNSQRHFTLSLSTIQKVVFFCSESHCLISDSLNYNTNAVHQFIPAVLSDIRAKRPNATKFICFNDGASSQWKNCKNFFNLCYHNSDRGFEAELNCFATSHGKSSYGGIGVTVKRLTAQASLLMTSGEVISTTYEMFRWCQGNVIGISFFYVSSEIINNHVNQFQLDERYELIKTVPGTRSYQSFILNGLSKLILRRKSK